MCVELSHRFIPGGVPLNDQNPAFLTDKKEVDRRLLALNELIRSLKGVDFVLVYSLATLYISI